MNDKIHSSYKKLGLEQRMQEDLRTLVQQYIDIGWGVVSRDPLVIERGHIKKIFENGVLKDFK